MESPILDFRESDRRSEFRLQIGVNPKDDFVHLGLIFEGQRIDLPLSPADAQSIAVNLVNSALHVEGRKNPVRAS